MYPYQFISLKFLHNFVEPLLNYLNIHARARMHTHNTRTKTIWEIIKASIESKSGGKKFVLFVLPLFMPTKEIWSTWAFSSSQPIFCHRAHWGARGWAWLYSIEICFKYIASNCANKYCMCTNLYTYNKRKEKQGKILSASRSNYLGFLCVCVCSLSPLVAWRTFIASLKRVWKISFHCLVFHVTIKLDCYLNFDLTSFSTRVYVAGLIPFCIRSDRIGFALDWHAFMLHILG